MDYQGFIQSHGIICNGTKTDMHDGKNYDTRINKTCMVGQAQIFFLMACHTDLTSFPSLNHIKAINS